MASPAAPAPAAASATRQQDESLGCCGCIGLVWTLLQLIFEFVSPFLEFFMPISVLWLILWLVFRPNDVRPQVDAAVLTTFSLGNATLDYDIAVDLSFHNSHKHLRVRYLDLGASASYGGARLGASADVLPVFVQRPKATNVVHAAFQGAAASLDPAAAEVFGREAADGSFNVLVTVTSTFMYKILFQKQVYYYEHQCYIRFPPASTAVLTPGTPCSAHSRR